MSEFGREWFESARRAFDASMVDGRTVKARVQFLLDSGLWDARKLAFESALARYHGCVDPAKREHFRIVEVWALMKRFGCHDLALAMVQDLGYQVVRAEPDDNPGAILRRLAQMNAEQERLLQRLIGLVAPTPPPPFQRGEGHFALPGDQDDPFNGPGF